MNSEKLYYKDSFMKEFDAVVAECTEENGVFKIVLDQTAFYPEGGGQPADSKNFSIIRKLSNLSERYSYNILASCAIVFTLVPPVIVPTL